MVSRCFRPLLGTEAFFVTRLSSLYYIIYILQYFNESFEILKETVKFASNYCDATIYQGIRVNDAIKERLKEREYEYTGKQDRHKVKDKEVDDIFKEIEQGFNGKYHIFDHTSLLLRQHP